MPEEPEGPNCEVAEMIGLRHDVMVELSFRLVKKVVQDELIPVGMSGLPVAVGVAADEDCRKSKKSASKQTNRCERKAGMEQRTGQVNLVSAM